MSAPTSQQTKHTLLCAHCGDPVIRDVFGFEDQPFCCLGCQTVYRIINDENLCSPDQIEQLESVKDDFFSKSFKGTSFDYLENEEIRDQVIDFWSSDHAIVTFSLPDIHCSSCVYLLEHLPRLQDGIQSSRVNFPKKEITVHFNPCQLSLKRLAEVLALLGYAPVIQLTKKDQQKATGMHNRLLALRIGVAGFCFGNIMLLSFPEYLGIRGTDFYYQQLFSYLMWMLSLPVMLFAGMPYLSSAARSIEQRYVNIDVPIALGMLALFVRSSYEIFSATGPGYLDSLSGLVFFLLIGKWFQSKTYASLSFDLDYQSFFPLAVQREESGSTQSVPIHRIEEGDYIVLRHEEIIPADCTVEEGHTQIDYAFVTGESRLQAVNTGDKVFAGGRIKGNAARFQVIRKTNNSYFTQLWNQPVFGEIKKAAPSQLINRVSLYFTATVIAIALAAATFWLIRDPSQIWLSVTAILIVACPCALALSVPFTFGSATRVFGKEHFYLKNSDTVEWIAQVDTLVFDKTGTLTQQQIHSLDYRGDTLLPAEKKMIGTLARQSVHPLSKSLAEHLAAFPAESLSHFREIEGMGIEAEVTGASVKIGSAAFTDHPIHDGQPGQQVYVKVGEKRGVFIMNSITREGMDQLMKNLATRYDLHVLSGDHAAGAQLLTPLLPDNSNIVCNQQPKDKLDYIKKLQDQGRRVMMIGDGLNDAGALKQSDVGIAVTDHFAHFTPASDGILAGHSLKNLGSFLQLCRRSQRIVWIAMAVSLLYNVIGLSVAAAALLTPLFAAILMPLSSITIVTLATGLVAFAALNLRKK